MGHACVAHIGRSYCDALPCSFEFMFTQAVVLLREHANYLQISFKQGMQLWRPPHKRYASDFICSQL